jgi:hypothetical protein
VNSKITFEGTPTEVWLHPVSINLAAPGGQAVEVKRCLDQSRLRVFANGEQVPQPQLGVPHVYRIAIIKKTSQTWWRTGPAKQGAKC